MFSAREYSRSRVIAGVLLEGLATCEDWGKSWDYFTELKYPCNCVQGAKIPCNVFWIKIPITFQNRGKSNHNILKQGQEWLSQMGIFALSEILWVLLLQKLSWIFLHLNPILMWFGRTLICLIMSNFLPQFTFGVLNIWNIKF